MRRVCLFALLLLVASAAPSMAADVETLLFDFGSPRSRTPDGWNNVTEPTATGVVIRQAMDVTGRLTSVALEQTDAWSGFNLSGHKGTGPFPAPAMGDSFYLGDRDDRTAQLKLTGLDPKSKYDFRFFASRMGGTRKRSAQYRIGTVAQHLNAFDNTEREVRIREVSPADDGSVTIDIECLPNQDNAYLGVLEITGRFPSAPRNREPAESLDGPPLVSAKAWAILDAKTGKLWRGYHAQTPREMASTTKIMTGWIVLELAAANPSILDQVVTFSQRADETGGSSAKIGTGEKLPVADLLYGLFLPSGNDAAVALAEQFGGQFEPAPGQSEEPYERFVAEMNRRAKDLGMEQTEYYDPHGNSHNRSTAADLLKLTYRAWQNERFRNYVGTPRHRCQIQMATGGKRLAIWKNTNHLLGIEGYDGVKTGTTSGAGACLVSSGHRDEDHIFMVVLGATTSDGRYLDTRNLYRWAWRQRGHK